MKTLLFLLFIQGCYFQKETLPEKYNIILCVGQSNMAGAGIIETQDSNSNAWLWNNSGWEKADGSLNRYSNIIPYPSYYLSMVNSFAKEAAKFPRYPYMGIVVNARGGTTITDWSGGMMVYGITRALEAQANNNGSKITAILWHQAETDAATPEIWLPNFRIVRHQVDSLIGYDTPILVGGICEQYYANYRVMNDTLRKVDLIHDCYFIPSDSLLCGDGVHFSAASLRTFGMRYYQKYTQVL